MAMCSAAVFAPRLVGANRTVKVVLPLGPLTGAVGLAVTVNIAACVPSIVMPSPVRLAEPVFLMVKVRLLVPPETKFTAPKLLLPPSAMLEPAGCSTAISGLTPVPVSAMSNGFSSLSLLAMWRAALRAPVAAGVNVTVKVVLAPGASVVAPSAPTVKSPGCEPSLVIVPRVRSASPILVMVKVRLVLAPRLTLPKSLLPASTMSVPAGCCTAISGASGPKARPLPPMLAKTPREVPAEENF